MSRIDQRKVTVTLAITLDVDWAPDYAIEDVAQLLIDRTVKATWFATHCSPALAFLRKHADLFEVGIHPNFNPGSSHGATMSQVVSHCLELVPEAVSARSHGLIQSDYLWRHYAESTPIQNECSTFLGHAPQVYASRFFWRGKGISRIPYNYQDNIEMDRPTPIWDAERFLEGKSGIQVLDFHPFYLYTNAFSMEAFESVKKIGRPFHEMPEDELLPLRREGPGARSMFIGLLNYLAERGGGCTMKEVASVAQSGDPV